MRIMLSSTGVACINTNRNFIGIELSEEDYNIAKERITNTVRKDCYYAQNKRRC